MTTDSTDKKSLIRAMASKYGVDEDKMMVTLKATAFKQSGSTVISNEQMMALLIVANQYNLNPWTKEIYAFPDKGGGIVPVVGVDGWARIINDNPNVDGVTFEQDETSCTCRIYRKDRNFPTQITEYLSECKRENVQPWKTHPRRMLRHKALIQCARIALGFAGIYDQDEAERIIEGELVVEPQSQPGKPKVNKPESKKEALEKLKSSAPADIIQEGKETVSVPRMPREPGADDEQEDEFLKGLNRGNSKV